MQKDQGGHKGRFECFECLSALRSEIPGGTFLGESCEGNRDIQVAMDEPLIEIGEAEEGLYIANLPRLGPVLNRLDLLLAHFVRFIQPL